MSVEDIQGVFQRIGPLTAMLVDRVKGPMGGNILPAADHGKPTGRIFVEFAWEVVTTEVIRVMHHLTFGNPPMTLKTARGYKGISRSGELEPFPARFDYELSYHPEIDRYTWKEWVESGKQCIVGNYDVQETRALQLR